MSESNWRRDLKYILILGLAAIAAAVETGVTRACADPRPAIQVETNYADVQTARVKITTLLTVLDYSIGRASSVQGVATGNFMRDCQKDNRLGLMAPVCEDIMRKHMTTSDAIYFPDGGMAWNMGRTIRSGEGIGFNIIASQTHTKVRLKLTLGWAAGLNNSLPGAEPGAHSEPWESEAAADYEKVVDWARFNFGAGKVTFGAQAKPDSSK